MNSTLILLSVAAGVGLVVLAIAFGVGALGGAFAANTEPAHRKVRLSGWRLWALIGLMVASTVVLYWLLMR